MPRGYPGSGRASLKRPFETVARSRPFQHTDSESEPEDPIISAGQPQSEPVVGVPLAFEAPAVYETQAPNDVRLVFLDGGEPTLELWASSALLKKASPYYKTMLDSGFKETELAHAQRMPSSSRPLNRADSDSELDKFYRSRPRNSTAVTSFKEIIVTEASYATYKCFLSWLHTGRITFAPLVASYSTPTARADEVARVHKEAPFRPLPCSPKSMYKLAHLLDISDLANIALNAYIAALAPTFALKEVFSNMLHYEQVKARLIKYAKDHKDAIRRTGGLADVKQAQKRGELKDIEGLVSEVLFELF